jgi:hypothetical protein
LRARIPLAGSLQRARIELDSFIMSHTPEITVLKGCVAFISAWQPRGRFRSFIKGNAPILPVLIAPLLLSLVLFEQPDRPILPPVQEYMRRMYRYSSEESTRKNTSMLFQMVVIYGSIMSARTARAERGAPLMASDSL